MPYVYDPFSWTLRLCLFVGVSVPRAVWARTTTEGHRQAAQHGDIIAQSLHHSVLQELSRTSSMTTMNPISLAHSLIQSGSLAEDSANSCPRSILTRSSEILIWWRLRRDLRQTLTGRSRTMWVYQCRRSSLLRLQSSSRLRIKTGKPPIVQTERLTRMYLDHNDFLYAVTFGGMFVDCFGLNSPEHTILFLLVTSEELQIPECATLYRML